MESSCESVPLPAPLPGKRLARTDLSVRDGKQQVVVKIATKPGRTHLALAKSD